MYENNNNYPNDLDFGSNRNQGNYGTNGYSDLYGNNTYSYDSTQSSSTYGTTNFNGTTQNTTEKKKKEHSGAKKILKFAGCGAVFGVCAGAAIACVLYFSPVHDEIENLKALQETATLKDSAGKIEDRKSVV